MTSITFETNALGAALREVRGAVQRRNTIPILSNVLVEAEADGTVRLTTTDLDVMVTYQAADTMNEHEVWREYLDYLERELGAPIQRVTAYDVPGLIDDAAFARRRQSIRDGWPHELRRKRHTADCKARRAGLPAASARCRPSPERVAAVREHAQLCDEHCPVMISPPVYQPRQRHEHADYDPGHRPVRRRQGAGRAHRHRHHRFQGGRRCDEHPDHRFGCRSLRRRYGDRQARRRHRDRRHHQGYRHPRRNQPRRVGIVDP